MVEVDESQFSCTTRLLHVSLGEGAKEGSETMAEEQLVKMRDRLLDRYRLNKDEEIGLHLPTAALKRAKNDIILREDIL